MSDNDIFDELDGRTEEPGNDFADWWDPDTAGEELVGVVVEMHSAPQEWTEAGEVPDTIWTVLSVGRGDVETGDAVTPKQHKQIKQGLKDVDLGDMVKIAFTGYQKVDGQPQPMYTYELGTVSQEEWEMMSGADDIKELLDEYSGVEGDNRRLTPYGSGSSSQEPQETVSEDTSQVGQAASALTELLSIQGGSVDTDTAERILVEVRGFDVDVEEAALYAGLNIEDDIIKQ